MRISLSTSQEPRSWRSQLAFTLPEILVSAAAGTMILGGMTATFLFMNRTLNGLANYEELDAKSRLALDMMSRDIRQSACMTNYSTNSIAFTNQDGTLLQYTWDGSNNVTYTNGTLSAGGVLLSNCNFCKFDIFIHTPSNGTTMTFWPAYTSNCNLAKVIVVNWICTRTNYASQTDSESVQTAKIVMRN